MFLLCLGLLGAGRLARGHPPQIVRAANGVAQLWVQDQPFLILGGELRNSSSSSLAYMEPIWGRLAAQHLNTVLAPVSWEQLEPAEGAFDFTLVDGLVHAARARRLHLVLLWFGTWKNMVSSYAPAWVRADPHRFPLTVDARGHWLPIPSTFGENTRQADARAFARLMRHLRQIDAVDQTVILIQVENEVGLPDSLRDRGAAAQAAFAGPVPAALTEILRHPEHLTREMRAAWTAAGAKSSGTWTDVFGPGPVAEEQFMAWNYGRYIDAVAAAGRAEYDLPCFVNAAIGRQNGLVGSYPGGGALPLAMDLWRLAAPHISFLSPDVYYGSFEGWCRAYSQAQNPFFIPETNGGESAAAHAFLAIGRWNAMGLSPFAIDDRPAGKDEFVEAYGLLEQLSPLILQHQADGAMTAAALDQEHPAQTLSLGAYTLEVKLRRVRKTTWVADHGYFLAIADGPSRFLIAGKDVDVMFGVAGPTPAVVELAQVQEGAFVRGQWAPGRRLNGDEIMLDYDFTALASRHQTGTGLSLGAAPALLRVDLFTRDSGP